MQLKEEALFTLKFDGKPVINELGELENKLNDVKEAQKTVEKGTKEWADNKAQIKELEASIKQVREEMGVSGMTVQQLQGYYRQLNSEIQKLTPGTEEYKKKAAELQEVNTAIANHRGNIRAVNEEIEKQPSLWERAKATAVGYLTAFSATELIERAFSFVQDGIKKALELSDAMSGVSKSTGQSAEEVAALSDELNKIDTRTTKESLMEIAQIGGQLGIANDELLGFVKSTDQATVALGDEFTGGAEEAGKSLGGLQKLFKETQELKAGDAISKIGSALNDLGASGTATAPVVADFTTRMGQLGDLSPQITQTLGLGAAFQELGLSAEISAGGLSNILLTAAKDTATFAQQLGISEGEMKKLINTNPNEFLLKLAESLRGLPADVVAKRLDDLGIKSQEATKVLSLLKDQTALVREKQDLANKSFQEGTSLQKEFNIVNSNAAAEYDKSQKAIALIATEIGQGLLPAITKGAQTIVTFVNIIRAIPEFISENRTSFAALGLAILAFNGHLVLATASSIAHAAAEKARLIWTNSATTAQLALDAAMEANPIGVIVAAIALFVAGLVAIYNNSETVRGVINGLWSAIKVGVGIVGDIASACYNFVKTGFEPLISYARLTGQGISFLWDVLTAGYGYVQAVQQALVSFAANGLGRVSTALIPVRTALANFWSLIDTGISKITAIGSTISSFLHLDTLVTKTKAAASQIGDAFNKGYGDKLAEGKPKQLSDHQATLDDKQKLDTKAAGDLVNIVTVADQKALDKKADQAEKHRIAEAKKQADHEKKINDEAVKANNEALKQIETLRIASIKDDLERSVATIRAKRDAEVEAMMASKASAETKAVWEKALNEQMIRDIAKATTDAATKKAADEEKARIDRESRERTTSNAVAESNYNAAHQALEKQLADETLKNSQRKTMELQLIDLERTETLRKIADQYAAEVSKLNKEKADAIRTAQEKGQAIDGLENQFRQQYQAAELERRTKETAAETAFQTDKKDIEKKALDARKANQQAWFDAIKGLMSGDFSTFTDFLSKKLSGEKKELSETQKAQIAKIDAVGQYTALGAQALSLISKAVLDKELSNINKEKTTQLAAWKEKYDKGLITKDQYEKGVDKINKDADAKTKQAQLDGFKRQQKIDIAQAIINGLLAVLKSFAMFGWPLGLISAAGAAVATGIQIAAIKAQQPPSLARGGKILNAGVPEGPRHGSSYGNGGLAITRRDTGEEVAEMEGGEPVMVLSRNTYANNRPVIDRLMHSSLHQNGAPVFAAGGIMFQDGGYTQEDHSSSVYNGSSSAATSQPVPGSEPVSDSSDNPASSGGSSWMDDANSAADSPDTSDYQAEVDKSTSLMEAIGKNTLATVDGIKLVADALGLLQQQVSKESTAQQSVMATLFASLRADTQAGFTGLASDNAQQSNALRLALHADLVALQGTMKVELPNLGKDLQDELALLRTAFSLGILLLRQGINVDVMSLQRVTQTGFDALSQNVHTDLANLESLLHEDMTTLQTGIHADLAQLQLTTSVQNALLRSDTKQNFSTLQAILKTELQTLQQNTHTDLASLANSNTAELRILQDILNRTKNEQGYQSLLLRVISEKNLSVSVQSIVSVWNQIDVVVEKSNFK